MRKQFFELLHKKMAEDERIVLVTADLGYGLLDKIRDTYPNRFFNVGAAEQLMLGVGVGLMLEGKIPFLYTITPFLLYRPAEWIRNYLGTANHSSQKCVLVGSGMENQYEHDGFTHHSYNTQSLCNHLGIHHTWIKNESELQSILEDALSTFNNYSTFIGLSR